jgi:hypothetical protein
MKTHQCLSDSYPANICVSKQVPCSDMLQIHAYAYAHAQRCCGSGSWLCSISCSWKHFVHTPHNHAHHTHTHNSIRTYTRTNKLYLHIECIPYTHTHVDINTHDGDADDNLERMHTRQHASVLDVLVYMIFDKSAPHTTRMQTPKHGCATQMHPDTKASEHIHTPTHSHATWGGSCRLHAPQIPQRMEPFGANRAFPRYPAAICREGDVIFVHWRADASPHTVGKVFVQEMQRLCVEMQRLKENGRQVHLRRMHE